jgi:circadian clock protein KaiB
MKKEKALFSTEWLDSGEELPFSLKLFITGASPNSVRAIKNLKNVCEKYITSGYELEIVDVYQQPANAKTEQLIALPMLIKYFPLPVKRLFGDLSDTAKVLKGLGLNKMIE